MNKTKKLTIIALACIVLSLAAVAVASAADEYNWDEWNDANEAAAGAVLFGLGLMCIIPAVLFIIGILLAIWVYKDAEKRGSSGALWLIIVILTSFVGLIIWLVVRPPIGGEKSATSSDRKCPNCGRSIPMDAKVCPYCGKDF